MSEKNIGMDPPGYVTKSRPLLAVSVLVLSLLLCVSITAYIVSTHQNKAYCVQEDPSTAQPRQAVSTNVNVKIDGKTSEEKVEYEERSKVSVVQLPDGSVTITDRRKGIAYMKDARSSECFAIATGVNAEEETNLGEYLSHYNGEELYEEVASNVTVTVLPGYIEDTSFIPPEAKERCSQFRWMAATNGEAGTEVQSHPGGRSKRGVICGSIWVASVYVRDRATRRLLYVIHYRYAVCLDNVVYTTVKGFYSYTQTPSSQLSG